MPRASVQPRDCWTLVVSEVFDTGEFLLGFLFIGRSSDERDPARRQLSLDAGRGRVDGPGLVVHGLDEDAA